jgi:localization factor PodJL
VSQAPREPAPTPASAAPFGGARGGFEAFDPFAPNTPALQQEPVRAAPVIPSRALPQIEEPPPFEMDPYADHLDSTAHAPFPDDGFPGMAPPRVGGRLSPEIRDDYLNAVRKAAQGHSVSKGKKDKAERSAKAASGLRGGNQVVFWGAAGAVAAALAGAAYYVNANSSTAIADAGQAPPEEDPFAPEAEGAFASAETAAADPSALEGAIDGLSLGPADAAAAPIGPQGAPTTVASATPSASAPATAPAPAPTRAGPVATQPVSLQQAATRGDPVAQYELALQNLAAGDGAEALTLLRSAANQGLAMAQYRLAKMYERGEGVPADLAQARQWTERAAAAGNSRAMHDLGVFFARGEGAPLDEAAAFRWFRQAAELGVEDSQFNLGVLYQQGRGAPANGAEALFWFLVAGANGDADARARAASLEAQLSPSEVAQARARAEAFRPRAASARANGDFGPRAWAS